MALQALHKDNQFNIGDRVRIHQLLKEDNKTRTQVFEGTVIAIRGEGQNKMFTVRRIGAMGIGIERIFPLFSPFVEAVEVRARGHVRRAKLYYIREKTSREIAEITKRRTVGPVKSNKPKVKALSRKRAKSSK